MSLAAISDLISDVIETISVISFTLFPKYRLETYFKNTFLSINKPFINKCIAACIISKSVCQISVLRETWMVRAVHMNIFHEADLRVTDQ